RRAIRESRALAARTPLMVLEARGELSQRELAEELCIDKSNVARLCAKMSREGQVVQRRAEDDGRSRRVALTPAGARLARAVAASSGARFGSVIAAIPTGARQSVVEALAVLVGAIETLDESTERRSA